jgi:hypothetical protein
VSASDDRATLRRLRERLRRQFGPELADEVEARAGAGREAALWLLTGGDSLAVCLRDHVRCMLEHLGPREGLGDSGREALVERLIRAANEAIASEIRRLAGSG